MLLKGLIRCQACDVAMTPTRTAKAHRHYRYYVCSNTLRGKNCQGLNSYLSAGEVERFVIQQVRHILESSQVKAQTTMLLEQAGLNKSHVFELLKDIDAVWAHLFPIEQQKIIQTFIRAVRVGTDGIDVRIHQEGLHRLISDTQDEVTL